MKASSSSGMKKEERRERMVSKEASLEWRLSGGRMKEEKRDKEGQRSEIRG